MKTIESLCAEYNINPEALSRFIDFARGHITSSQEHTAEFLKNPDEALKKMMTSYTKMVTEISQEIIDNKTPRAKQFRDDCYNYCQNAKI